MTGNVPAKRGSAQKKRKVEVERPTSDTSAVATKADIIRIERRLERLESMMEEALDMLSDAEHDREGTARSTGAKKNSSPKKDKGKGKAK